LQTVEAHDANIEKAYLGIQRTQSTVVSTAAAVRRALDHSGEVNRPLKRLQAADKKLQKSYSEFTELQKLGSGVVDTTDLPLPETLFDRSLLVEPVSSEIRGVSTIPLVSVFEVLNLHVFLELSCKQ